jgi:hypothetical protein
MAVFARRTALPLGFHSGTASAIIALDAEKGDLEMKQHHHN